MHHMIKTQMLENRFTLAHSLKRDPRWIALQSAAKQQQSGIQEAILRPPECLYVFFFLCRMAIYNGANVPQMQIKCLALGCGVAPLNRIGESDRQCWLLTWHAAVNFPWPQHNASWPWHVNRLLQLYCTI